MPIFDYICKCGKEKKDELVKKHDQVVTCECGKEMDKKISAPWVGGMDAYGRSGNH